MNDEQKRQLAAQVEHARRARAAAVSVTGSGPGYRPSSQPRSVWPKSDRWPQSTRTLVFLAEAVDRLGRSLQGNAWGREDATERAAVASQLVGALADGELAAFAVERDNGSVSPISADRWRASDAGQLCETCSIGDGWIFVAGAGLTQQLAAKGAPVDQSAGGEPWNRSSSEAMKQWIVREDVRKEAAKHEASSRKKAKIVRLPTKG